MKKIIGLICLMFVLVSCAEEKIVKQDKLIDSKVELDVEEKVIESLKFNKKILQLSTKSPYKDLYDIKWWSLTDNAYK